MQSHKRKKDYLFLPTESIASALALGGMLWHDDAVLLRVSVPNLWRSNLNKSLCLCATVCTLAVEAAFPADDSASFRGPNHDGTYRESKIRVNWQEKPPVILWSQNAGYGFSGVAVSGKRVLAAGYSIETGKSTLSCFDSDSGRVNWQIEYADTCGGKRRGLIGPIATPVIDGDRVYMVACMGVLYCFDLAKGAKLWEQAANKDKENGKPFGEYGDGASPVVVGDLVLAHLTVDSGSAAWFAFARQDGKQAWSHPVKQREVKSGNPDRAYSSAAPCDINGAPHVILVSNTGIDCVDAKTGRQAWTYSMADHEMTYGPFPAPVFFAKDKFFLGTWYSGKAHGNAFQINENGLTPLWKNDAIGKGAYSSVVYNGCLFGYGVKGLNCVNAADGEIKWKWRASSSAVAKDQGEIILIGDKLVWISSSGILYVGEALPDKAGPVAEFKALGACTRDLRKDKAQYNNVVSTSPSFAAGRVYCRSPWGEIVCVDVGE